MPYVSFISARRRLASAAGVVAPLRPCPDYRLAPFLGLGHGQTPQARPPAPKLPQPWVDLVHVAPPAAISGGCVGGPVLEVTYRMGVGDGSYSLVVARSMGPVTGTLSSSKVLKNTKQISMSSGPRVQELFLGGLPSRGRKRHLKNLHTC